MRQILVHTWSGWVYVEGDPVGEVWAVTKSVDSRDKTRGHIWRVTHLPSGRAGVKPTTKKVARRIARALERECSDEGWRSPTPHDVVPQKELRRAGRIIESMGATATQAPYAKVAKP